MSEKDDTNSQATSDYTAGRESSMGSTRDTVFEVSVALNIPQELVVQDRFRVDRKKMETLLFGGDETAAERFFDETMQETHTRIEWPAKLKLNAKSRKDPHIRIFGRQENVRRAREKVLSSFDIKGNRVSMKIDVSYTDHSHIIGRGGGTIKKVMEATGCHIHFPDSNRTSSDRKSNQVSIAGDVFGVEKARAKVRELTPLMFCFDLPTLKALTAPDLQSPFIINTQEKFNVQITLRTRQKLDSTLVAVKGSESEVGQVMEATLRLMKHMCHAFEDQILVHMMMEISPQYHKIVLGRNNENVKIIMENTSTQIIFLDPNDPNIPSLKKSNVTITGSIHNVYRARQQLIGSLPVILMFDVPENGEYANAQVMNKIMKDHDVYISSKLKTKQNVISFTIRGVEASVGNVYNARRELLGVNEPPVPVMIPSTYMVPRSSPILPAFWALHNENNGLTIRSPQVTDKAFNFREAARKQLLPLSPQPCELPTPCPNWAPASFPTQIVHPHHHHHHRQLPPFLLSYSPGIITHIPRTLPQNNNHIGNGLGPQPATPPSMYFVPSNGHTPLSSNTSSLSSPFVSPRETSPVHQSCDKKESNEPPRNRVPPGFENHVSNSLNDFQKMHFQAVKALQKPVTQEVIRSPNSVWSGFGLSASSPTQTKDIFGTHNGSSSGCSTNENISDGASGGMQVSDHLDYLTDNFTSTAQKYGEDLNSLLIGANLYRYARLLEQHEIDVETFRTLSDLDLKEMGINAVGARRKLLALIAEMNASTVRFSGSAAPGAERSQN